MTGFAGAGKLDGSEFDSEDLMYISIFTPNGIQPARALSSTSEGGERG